MIPQWLVIFNERDGVRFYGPFPSKDEARSWAVSVFAEEAKSRYEDYQDFMVAPLHAPDDVDLEHEGEQTA